MYFLNINKPKGISSFDVVRILRKKLNIKQIGHSGTLDPLASGVLQVAVGKATKLLDYLDSDKTYIAEIIFGYNSTTYDSEGEKTFIKEPNFTYDELLTCLNSFIGEQLQYPPKYSAIKLNGRKMCDLMRQNKEDEIILTPRQIEIYYIKLLDYSNNSAKIEVSCKRGTYIRSLVYDIGQKLDVGAYINNLTRIKAGMFDINNSDSIDSDNFKQISPLKCLNLPQYNLSDIEYKRIIHGNFISYTEPFISNIILLTKNNKLVSLANLSDNQIKPKRIFEELV